MPDSGFHTIDWDYNTNHKFDNGDNYLGRSYYFNNTTLSAKKIPEANQKFYQFKLVSENGTKAYAIRQNGNGNNIFYAIDLQTSIDRDEGGHLINYSSTVLSLDALNLLKGSTGGYTVPKSTSELSAITGSDNKVYDKTGLMSDYISKKLGYAGIEASIPTLSKTDDSYDVNKIKRGPNLFLVMTSLI